MEHKGERVTNIAVAGTFNRLHKGHKAMLDKAFSLVTTPGDKVYIGITSDIFASKDRCVSVRPYSERYAHVMEYAYEKNYHSWVAFEIVNSLMLTFMKCIDILVVSEETKNNGDYIRDRLAKEGKNLEIVIVPLVKNADGTKLSATDIINRKYDEEGNKIDNIESCGESVFRCNRCQTPCKLTIRKDGVITPYMCPFSNYAADWEEVHMPDEETDEVKMVKQTDCGKCIYKYNLKPTKIADDYYIIDGFMHCSYTHGDNKDNITRDRCSKCMRMNKPFCPLFDDGKEVKE